MIIMPDDLDKKNPFIKRVKVISLIITGLFLIYVIVGFWVIPPLLKPRLEEQLSTLLGRKVTIESIKLNPLVLSATTSNLTVYGTEGEPFAGFEELFVDAQLISILNWALTIKEIRIQSPFGVLKLLPGNKLNIDDILAKLSQPKSEPDQEAGLPRGVIEKFQLIEGKATLENLTGKEPIREVVGPISFTLKNLSTLKGRQGEYLFAGKGPSGERYEVKGQLTVNPVRVQGSYLMAGVQLSHYWEHVEDLLSFQITRGTVGASGNYMVEIAGSQINARLGNGTFELKDFELVEKGKQEVLIALPTLSVKGITADLNDREIVFDRIQSADAAIKSRLSAGGSIELQRLLQPDIEKLMASKGPGAPEVETSETRPWQAAVNSIEVKDWDFTLDDLTGKDPIRENFALISFTAENLSTKKDQKGVIALVGKGPSGGKYQLNGQLTVNPVWVQGGYSVTDAKLSHFWEHIKDHVSFQIINGSTGATGDFTAAIGDGAFSAKLENGTYELSNFELVEKGKKDVLISLPVLTVEGIGADLGTREINVEMIRAADAKIKSWLSADGTFGLQNLFLPDLEKLRAEKASDATEPETAPAKQWQVTLEKMEATNWGLALEDRTLKKPARMTVDDLNVSAENFSTKKGSQANVGIAMQINRSGKVKINGTAGIDPLVVDVNAASEKIALISFQPYVDEAVNAQIVSGTTSSKGRIRFRGQDARPQIRYTGEFSIENLEVKDRVHADDFITLAQFKTGGIALDLSPNKLNASEVLIDRPYARVTIDQNGSINVVNAFTPVEKKGEKGKENLLQRLVNFLILQFKGPMPMNFNRVQLKNFKGDFVDSSISPTYSTHMEITDGTVKGLSSDPSAMADIKFVGKIDQTATIAGIGRMNPLNALRYSKVDVSLKEYELKPVSPYSAKFIGYKIDKGTLHTELKYTVEDDKVNGNNIIQIDHLELGEKVDSSDALDLPIELGVSLLKDANDRITLQVPVKGDIKDPKFDFNETIVNALTGTITNVASAPFAAISKLGGFKGEELRTVAFDFGSSDLQAHEIEKLSALAKILKEKKSLILGVTGSADRQMDWAAISGESSEKIQSEDTIMSEKNIKEGPAAGQRINEEKLKQLAHMRAEMVRSYLVEKANVEAGRLQIEPVQIKPSPDGEKGRVELSLSLK
jgi:outer membrane protein OmpA-like peptidoglycan-associated protein